MCRVGRIQKRMEANLSCRVGVVHLRSNVVE